MSTPSNEFTDFAPGISRYGRRYMPSVKARENMEAKKDPNAQVQKLRSSQEVKGSEPGQKDPKVKIEIPQSDLEAKGGQPGPVSDNKENLDAVETKSQASESRVDDKQKGADQNHNQDTKSRTSKSSKNHKGSHRSSVSSSSSKRDEFERRVQFELTAMRLTQRRLEDLMTRMADDQGSASEKSNRSHRSLLPKTEPREPDTHQQTSDWLKYHHDGNPGANLQRDGPLDWIPRLYQENPTAHGTPGIAASMTATPIGALCMDFANLAVAKKFNGNALDWFEWSLSFRNKIHDNPGLTKSQKLSLLQESLGEGPKSRIFGLLWNTNSYELALQKLNELYGNKHAIVEAHIREVRSWNSKDNSTNLSEFCILVSKLVQVFQSLGFEADLKGQALLYDLTGKLNFGQRKSWGKFVQRHGYQDVALFEAWLSHEEEALRLGGAWKISGNGNSPRNGSGSSRDRGYYMNGLGLGSDAPTPPGNKRCIFCSSAEHWVDSCSRFLAKSPSERLKWFLDERRCFRCSRKGHRKENCKSSARCRISACGKRHASVLHLAVGENASNVNVNVNLTDGSEVPDSQPQPENSPIEAHIENVGISPSNASSNSRAYLQILKVSVTSHDGLTLTTYALLDSGSQTSLISNRLTERLNLRGPVRRLAMKNVVKDIEPAKLKMVRFSVRDPNDLSRPALTVPEAWSLESMNLPSQILPRDSAGEPLWEHVKGLGIPDVMGSEIELLLGANCKGALTQVKVIQGPATLPNAILTPLGWCLLGGHGSVDPPSQNVIALPEPDDLSSLLERFWSIDDFGCKFSDKKELSIEDRQALDILERETRLTTSGRYEVPMLWRDGTPTLPDNRAQAEARYQSLRRKLLKNPSQMTAYTETMGKYINDGYLRKLNPTEIKSVSSLTHYLVHFGVTHPFKNKLRVVMDASLKYGGSALNDHLLMGPFLTNSLVGLIMRFRRGEIAMSADIESMFYRVLVPDHMRPALRVLYSEYMSPQPNTFEFECHVFGAACSPSCATYALMRTAQDNIGNYPDSSVHEILRSFYVDDFLSSCDEEKAAVEITNDVIKIAAGGGFKLTKWVSTSQSVLDAAASSKGISTEVDLNLEDNPTSRVLGVHWSVKGDMLSFKLTGPLQTDCAPTTKRSLVRLVCSIFDPLCFLAPFNVRARILIQELWALCVSWDEELDENSLCAWSAWVSELQTIENFSVPRKYWPASLSPSRIDLHVFCDSSESAYAAVCFVRVESQSGERHVSFVMARLRVAPLGKKALSLPRLELQAAVLATRLATTVCEEIDLNYNQVYFWSDSNIVLSYLANTKRRFKTFVANRIAEIGSVSDVRQWRFCPGVLNPSDLATRGIPLKELTVNSPWLRGPNFLWDTERNWPAQPEPTQVSALDAEIRPELHVGILVGPTPTRDTPPPIDPARYSSLDKLLRATARCLRYTRNLRAKVAARKGSPHTFLTGALNVAEFYDARIFWIKLTQREAFQEEILKLFKAKSRQVRPKSVLHGSKIVSLHPFLDRMEVLRVGGRIYEANVPYDAMHQTILPAKHRFTELLALDVHSRSLHCGPEQIVSSMRELYWVPSLRPLARKIVNDCPLCKRENATPAIPKMAPLPLARVQQDGIWGHTGMDVFGPILVKQRRSQVKRWGLLFCSMNVRAVHIEIIRSIDADSFIMALRRFIARRGEVSNLYCDSGSNFTGAAPELKAAVRKLNSDEKFRNYMTSKEIQFHFMPPKASHFGGSWEILIKSIKRALRIVLRDHIVHEDTLSTVLCEIASAMNSRPISYVGDDPENPAPLTPNHFLHHSATQVSPPKLTEDTDSSSRRRWRQSQIVTEHLWRRWRKEYLPSLTISHKWHEEKRSLQVGDVVLVVDHSAPRGSWQIARVVETNVGRDTRVRSAKLKTKGGYLTRPASLICLLEEASSNF